MSLNLILITLTDHFLQVNRTDLSLQPLKNRALQEGETTWSIENRLLLCQGRLAVPDIEVDGCPIRTSIIREAHAQASTAHLGIAKTAKILKSRYYWKELISDVKTYVSNCHACNRAHVWRDKTPRLLHPLPVPDRPQKHISIDFKSMPKDKGGFDAILVFVDRLGKRLISIPCYKTSTARELAHYFITHVWRYYGPPDSIVSDRGLQFISDFQKEFYFILGIQMKLSTANVL